MVVDYNWILCSAKKDPEFLGKGYQIWTLRDTSTLLKVDSTKGWPFFLFKSLFVLFPFIVPFLFLWRKYLSSLYLFSSFNINHSTERERERERESTSFTCKLETTRARALTIPSTTLVFFGCLQWESESIVCIHNNWLRFLFYGQKTKEARIIGISPQKKNIFIDYNEQDSLTKV